MSSLERPAIDMEPPRIPTLLLNSRDAAAALAIGTTTLNALANDGEIRQIKIGAATRYDPRDLVAWIDWKKTKQKPKANND